mgnify:CR=1 FL=1
MIDRLWNPFVAAWYQEGKDDPKLALLRLDAERAEIWENGSSLIAGANYAAAKGAIAALTRQMAMEFGPHGITVNCVCPGPTDTALFASMGGPKLREALTKAIPFRRLAQPSDIAPGAVFLAYCASDVPSLFVRLIRRRSGGAR